MTKPKSVCNQQAMRFPTAFLVPHPETTESGVSRRWEEGSLEQGSLFVNVRLQAGKRSGPMFPAEWSCTRFCPPPAGTPPSLPVEQSDGKNAAPVWEDL
jgi:hypothetical protein